MSACFGVNTSSRAEPRHAYHGFSSVHLTQVGVNAAIMSRLQAVKAAPVLLEKGHHLIVRQQLELHAGI